MATTVQHRVRRTPNNRVLLAIAAALAVAWVLFIVILSAAYPEDAVRPTGGQRNEPPSGEFLFGTDWLGRDMFARTVMGLDLSLRIGLVTAAISVVVSLVLGVLAAMGPKWLDNVVNWLVDMTLGLPHIIASLLISFSVGGGALGIMLGVGLTQWAPLARLIRAEILRVREEPYVAMSRARGKTTWFLVTRHYLPAVLAHVIVGLVYLLPHSILHESSLTFLGFGLDPTVPSLGIILSEGLRFLSRGQWWLVLGPIAMLLVLVILLEMCSQLLRTLMSPKSRHH